MCPRGKVGWGWEWGRVQPTRSASDRGANELTPVLVELLVAALTVPPGAISEPFWL